MTSTPGSITSPTTTAIDRLLAAIEAGTGGTVADLYAADARIDLTVPGWRFTCRGGQEIAAEYARWFDAPARFEELERDATPSGEVVRYLVTSESNGVPYAVHHCHLLRVDAETGLIAEEHVFCGGRWDDALMARMAEADTAG